MHAGLLLDDFVTRAARAWPGNDAFVWGGRRRTYAETAERVARLAALLRDAGVAAGSRLAYLLPNCPEAIELCLAASTVGAVVVPLNARLDAAAMRWQLDDADVRLGLTHPLFEATAREAGLADRTCWIVGEDLDGRLHEAEPTRGALRSDPDAPCVQLYTSGTTGTPKGCLLGSRSWWASSANLAHCLGIRAGDRVVQALPVFHVAGFGLTLAHLAMGGTIAFPAALDHGELWGLVDELRATTVVPGSIGGMIDHGDASRVPRPFLRTWVGGAGVEQRTTLERFQELFPDTRFHGGYGCTEAGNFVTSSTDVDELARPGTIGRPLYAFDVRIGGEDDEAVAPGVAGEVLVRGPSTMLGYAALPDATAETLRNGWLHTGDVASMDEDGYLFFLDRLKDMVKTGGENVYCVEVERVLAAHSQVADVAVVGVPDERWGEAVKAVVVRRGEEALRFELLDEWCRARLAGFKRPRWWEEVEALPRAMGKVVKIELRAAHDPRRAVRLDERSRVSTEQGRRRV